MIFLQRLAITFTILLLWGCNRSPTSGSLSIGLVSYGEGERSIEQYEALESYLGDKMNSFIEVEPTYNELKAIEEINRQTWDLVFANPGLVAIAISEGKYTPLFPLEGESSNLSVIVVEEDSSLQTLKQLSGKRLALSQQGSARGYYLPIFNLYGLTLAEIRFSPLPKTTLEWIANQEVDAGAMSQADYERHRTSIPTARFRILYTDNHEIPGGALLVSNRLSTEEQETIRQVLRSAPSKITKSAGYLPNSPVPSYDDMVKVVQRVRPIAERIREQPAPLYEKKE
ncbi:MAG: phosphate/phosphite/phosphonate ABC transporter substrate-binding protein [Microcystaceae cyanobacterium]